MSGKSLFFVGIFLCLLVAIYVYQNTDQPAPNAVALGQQADTSSDSHSYAPDSTADHEAVKAASASNILERSSAEEHLTNVPVSLVTNRQPVPHDVPMSEFADAVIGQMRGIRLDDDEP